MSENTCKSCATIGEVSACGAARTALFTLPDGTSIACADRCCPFPWARHGTVDANGNLTLEPQDLPVSIHLVLHPDSPNAIKLDWNGKEYAGEGLGAFVVSNKKILTPEEISAGLIEVLCPWELRQGSGITPGTGEVDTWFLGKCLQGQTSHPDGWMVEIRLNDLLGVDYANLRDSTGQNEHTLDLRGRYTGEFPIDANSYPLNLGISTDGCKIYISGGAYDFLGCDCQQYDEEGNEITGGCPCNYGWENGLDVIIIPTAAFSRVSRFFSGHSSRLTYRIYCNEEATDSCACRGDCGVESYSSASFTISQIL